MPGRGSFGQAFSWGSERIPLTEVREGSVYNAVVTGTASNAGIFVDFGAEKDGLLRVPESHVHAYRRGVQVFGAVVLSCQPEQGKTLLQLDPRATLAAPRPKSRSKSAASRRRSRSTDTSYSAVSAPHYSAVSAPQSPAPRGRRRRARSQSQGHSHSQGAAAGGADRAHSQSRPRRDWYRHEGIGPEELQPGKLVDGVVTGVNRFGVFVDIGCRKDGRLQLPRHNFWQFKVGDQLHDVHVQSVDTRTWRISLALPDLEAAMHHLNRERVPLEELHEGMIVNGIICNAGPHGVFVNIGAVKDGKLRVPRRVQFMMLPGEQVQGMRIDRLDLPRQRISLSFDEGAPRPEPCAPGAGPAAPARSRSAARSLDSMDAPLIPLEDIRVGELADGIVVGATSRQVLVDIGAEIHGMLALPAELRQRFQIGDMVEGMIVEDVDLERRQVILSMDDPELAVVDGGRPHDAPAAGHLRAQRTPPTSRLLWPAVDAGAQGLRGEAEAEPRRRRARSRTSGSPGARGAREARAKLKAKAKAI